MPTCPKCFKHNPGEAAFCGFCGASIHTQAADAAKKTVFGYNVTDSETVADDAPTEPIPAPAPVAPAPAPVAPAPAPAPVAPAPAPAPVAPAPAPAPVAPAPAPAPVAPAPAPAPVAPAPAAPAPAAPAPAAPGIAVGATIAGKYRLDSETDTLSVGKVWAATETSSGNSVALLLAAPAAFPSPLDLERARREMRQLQKVDSERILKIIDHGKHQDQLFVVTEAVSGVSLTMILSANKLPLDNAQKLIKQIGAALAEAQKVGVIHRDLAPHNVLVASDGSVKLRGFGIAPSIKRHVFGTPEYISPEQSAGRPVDQRSNIYSIGVLMYQMLAGAPPFSGSVEELIEHHQKSEAPPLPAELNVPPRVTQLITKALSKSSSRRHLTLRQFLREVDSLVGAGAAPTPTAPPKPMSFETPLHGVTALTGGDRPPTAEQRAVPPADTDAAQASTEPGLPATEVSAPPVSAPPVSAPPVSAPPVSAPPATAPPTAGVPAQPPAPADDPATSKTFPPVTPDGGGSVGGEMRNGERISMRQSSEYPTVDKATGEPSEDNKPEAKQAPAPAQPPAGAGKGGFRETMWFFKGEMESAMAEEGEERPAVEEENPDLQVKYADDGSIEANSEAARLSLRTGNTQAMQAVNIPDGKLPGSKMEDAEFIKEMGYKHTRIGIYIGGAVVLAGVIGLVLWLVLR